MYLKKYNLKNKYSLVTGAGKGLGRACAIALAEAGSNLIIISRTKKDLDSVSKIIKKKYEKIKILGQGEIKDKLNLEVHYLSNSAKEKLSKNGSTIKILESK